jgi:hypothetical protein
LPHTGNPLLLQWICDKFKAHIRVAKHLRIFLQSNINHCHYMTRTYELNKNIQTQS